MKSQDLLKSLENKIFTVKKTEKNLRLLPMLNVCNKMQVKFDKSTQCYVLNLYINKNWMFYNGLRLEYVFKFLSVSDIKILTEEKPQYLLFTEFEKQVTGKKIAFIDRHTVKRVLFDFKLLKNYIENDCIIEGVAEFKAGMLYIKNVQALTTHLFNEVSKADIYKINNYYFIIYLSVNYAIIDVFKMEV